MKLRFETKLEKFGGPPDCRGPPVEKHCYKVGYVKFVLVSGLPYEKNPLNTDFVSQKNFL